MRSTLQLENRHITAWAAVQRTRSAKRLQSTSSWVECFDKALIHKVSSLNDDIWRFIVTDGYILFAVPILYQGVRDIVLPAGVFKNGEPKVLREDDFAAECHFPPVDDIFKDVKREARYGDMCIIDSAFLQAALDVIQQDCVVGSFSEGSQPRKRVQFWFGDNAPTVVSWPSSIQGPGIAMSTSFAFLSMVRH